MKIAFCVLKNLDFCGGIEKNTLEVGSRLVKRGHEVSVYCMRHYGEVPDEVAGMRIIAVPCVALRRFEKFTASATAVLHVLFKNKPDVVHFQHITPGSFAWVAKLGGLKCICQAHGVAWRSTPWGRGAAAVLRTLERIAMRSCDIPVAVTETQRRFYRARYGLDAAYVPSGMAIEQPLQPREILRWNLEARGYVLYVGRLSPEKGPHYLIPAFRRLDTECKLVLAGGSSDERYRRRLEALSGDDPRIMFTGFVRGRALGELLSNALVYVQPSELEGLSHALLEAMSYGNCCLVSDIPENLEPLADTGWSFETRNIISLSERLQWLLDHPEESLRAGQKARARAAGHYAWDEVTTRLERVYERLLGDGSAQRIAS
jgi:glycosyltransferase involved in cell wall biosynthesis